MSNHFGPLAKGDATVDLNIGTGPIGASTVFQGFNLDPNGAIYAVDDGVIAVVTSGLPYDVNGRLVVSTTGA